MASIVTSSFFFFILEYVYDP